MNVTTINPNLQVVSRKTSHQNSDQKSSIQADGKYLLCMDLIEEFLDGILIFTEQQQLLYASDCAYRTLDLLHSNASTENIIPEEISHICQSLVQSRHRFPNQNWLIEFDIFTQDSTILHIRSRWLTIDRLEQPCLVLVIEDRQQAIASILIEEANQYGLTPREREVWMLHRNDLTYKQIAMELGITPNTVKKHMRSIHAKKKLALSTLG